MGNGDHVGITDNLIPWQRMIATHYCTFKNWIVALQDVTSSQRLTWFTHINIFPRSLLQDCLASIRSWMNHNQLKLNDDKTEFMIIGKPNSLKHLPSEKVIVIGDERIIATDSAKNIGVVLDTHLHMDSQIHSICRSSYMRYISLEKSNLFSHLKQYLLLFMSW